MTTYVVPVSGGKDSQAVLSVAVEKHGAANVIALHNYTGIDHPLTMEHMEWMEGFYGVPIEHTVNPKYADMWDLIDKRNTIPGRNARFCTQELKIRAMNHWLDGRRNQLKDLVVLMGMRQQESRERAARYDDITPDDVFSLCDLNANQVPKRFKDVRVMLPIVDRSTSWVYEFMRKRGEKLNPLYARGHRRVGCYPCILASKHDFRLAARDPVGRETLIKLRDFKDLIVEARKIEDPSIIVRHDLHQLLDEVDADPFGFYADEDDDDAGGCQFCE